MRERSVLLVDDESRTVHFLRSELGAANYRTLSANSGQDALQLIKDEDVDLVVLDVMMPGLDGLETCRRIRDLCSVPIVMLSGNTEQSTKIKSLALGADDYLTKPFDPEELVARINAILRRRNGIGAGHPEDSHSVANPSDEAPFRCGDLVVDYANRAVTLFGEEIRFSPIEYRLLCQLTRNAGRVLPHEYLLTAVWGPESSGDTKYLWVYIGYLREKLEENPKQPRYIITVPGFGYRFRRPD